MAEEAIRARLAEGRDQALRVDLDLGRDHLGRELDDVALLRFTNADHVGRAQLVIEDRAADGDCLRALLQVVDEPVRKRLVRS